MDKITVELNEEAINALMVMIDSYVRQQGLQAAEPCLALGRILQTAVSDHKKEQEEQKKEE